MGCNCNKNRTAPLGSPNNPKTNKGKDKLSMPTLDKGRSKEQTFTLQTKDGLVLTFGSALEARAERKRRGGGTLR